MDQKVASIQPSSFPMGFIVYTSHAYPSLVDILCDQLIEETRSREMKETTIVVPNHTVANWLSNRIADRLGICLNIRFTYPDSLFVERLGDSDKDNCRLIWTLDILTAMQSHEIESPLITDQTEGLVVAQYAWELSGLLRKYAEYRREWLDDWEISAMDEQNTLHQQCWEVIRRAGHAEADILLAMGNRLRQSPPASIPESLHLFGFWEFSAARWSLIEALYPDIPVHAYLSFPSLTYLVDLTRKNLQLPLFNESDDTLLNPRLKLLSKLVARGRSFQAFLLDQNAHSEQLQAKLPSGHSMLGVLQRLLIEPESAETGKTLAALEDDTIQIHSCTSRKRELETVKARIQCALHRDPSLKLEDIHVYAPDIHDYADWIPVVFSEEESRFELAYNIRESFEPDQIPVFRTILRILEIQGSQWSAKSVRELLMLDSIRQQYGFLPGDVEKIFEWITDAGIVGGNQNNPDNDASRPDLYYSWEAGLNRLIQNYACAPDALFQTMFTHSPGDRSECFEAFLRFFRDLENIGERLRTMEKDPASLIRIMDRVIQIFIPKDFHPYEQSALQKTLVEIGHAFSEHPESEFSLAVITFLLRKNLPRLPSPTALSRKSGILFSSIRYEEMIPGKLKLIMGLSEGSFPRNDPQRSYDLMQSETARFGDPSMRENDLYWLLHSIILTEKQWITTYVGLDEFNNETRPVSTVLLSILETVNTVIPRRNGSSEPLLSITVQPRFAYEEACFLGDELKTHFDRSSFFAASNIQTPKPPHEFLDQLSSGIRDTATEMQQESSTAELIRYYTHPSRYYCKENLGLSRFKHKGEDADNEPLLWTKDNLDNYQINQIGLQAMLKGVDSSITKSWLIKTGKLPAGYSGDLEFETLWDNWKDETDDWKNRLQLSLDPDELESTIQQIGKYSLQMPRLKRNYPSLGFIQPGNLRKKDEMELWIYSLVLWLNIPEDHRPDITLIGKDKSRIFSPPEDPEKVLLELLDLRSKFSSCPLPFYPEISFVAYKQRETDPEGLLQHNKWISQEYGGESEDPFIRLLLPSSGNPFSATFYEVANQIYSLMETCVSASKKG